MTKKKILLPNIIFTALFFLTFSLSALEIQKSNKPEFILAIFATNRTRATLIDKANDRNIRCYNVNWQSKVDLDNNCIKNVWIRAAGKWFRLKKVPLPNVVYDFGVYKNARKRKEQARLLKEQLRNAGIPFINPEEALIAVNDKLNFAKVCMKSKYPILRRTNIKNPS